MLQENKSSPVVIRYKSNICHLCGTGTGTLETKKKILNSVLI